jgi:hypothetical protein
MQYVSCRKYDPCECGHVREEHSFHSRHHWCMECDCDTFTLKCATLKVEVANDMVQETK